MMLEEHGALETKIREALIVYPALAKLVLEPVKGAATADLQGESAITFSFATTGRVSRLQRAGILAVHFYAADAEAALKPAYRTELDIEDALSANESDHYTIAGCQFDTRLPLIDEDTREFINVECTYNIQYTIRR